MFITNFTNFNKILDDCFKQSQKRLKKIYFVLSILCYIFKGKPMYICRLRELLNLQITKKIGLKSQDRKVQHFLKVHTNLTDPPPFVNNNDLSNIALTRTLK
jgi:hypothetical protein